MSETPEESGNPRRQEARWTAVVRVQPQGEENLRWVHLSYALQAREWQDMIAAARKGSGFASSSPVG